MTVVLTFTYYNTLQGDHVADSLLKKSRPPSALAWHPTKKILAVGWETGEMTVWNEQDHEAYEVNPQHKTEITILQWTSNGTKLLSGDSVSYCKLMILNK